jgi:hypothetical protein
MMVCASMRSHKKRAIWPFFVLHVAALSRMVCPDYCGFKPTALATAAPAAISSL